MDQHLSQDMSMPSATKEHVIDPEQELFNKREEAEANKQMGNQFYKKR